MLAELIRTYLDENGIKYIYAAERIDMSISAFSAMLNGNRKLTAEEFLNLCDALGIAVTYFAERFNDQPATR